MLSIGWYTTARDEQAITLFSSVIREIQEGNLPVSIKFCFLNRSAGEHPLADRLMALARHNGIHVVTLSSRQFLQSLRQKGKRSPEEKERWRKEFHREVMRLVRNFRVDLGLLVGYMLVVSEEMCSSLDLVNLHPALPGGPSGTWQEVIDALIQNKATHAGITLHRVTPVLDSGPVLAFCRYSIRGEPFDAQWRRLNGQGTSEEARRELKRLIRQAGVRREVPFLLHSLYALSSGELSLGSPVPLDLTKRVESYLRNVSQPNSL